MTATTRFIPGQSYTFVRTLFTPKRPSFGGLFLPWEDTLIGTEVVTLTCSEHKKVAWDQDPKAEPLHDGFLFKDSENQIWANQYPAASYGQLDSSQDYIVQRHFETSELLQVDADGECLKDDAGNYLRKTGTEELWAVFDGQFMNPFTQAEKILGTMYRAIHPAPGKLSPLEPFQIKSLDAYFNTVVSKVETISGKKVVFEPVVMNYTDGRPSRVTGFTRAVLKEPEHA